MKQGIRPTKQKGQPFPGCQWPEGQRLVRVDHSAFAGESTQRCPMIQFRAVNLKENGVGQALAYWRSGSHRLPALLLPLYRLWSVLKGLGHCPGSHLGFLCAGNRPQTVYHDQSHPLCGGPHVLTLTPRNRRKFMSPDFRAHRNPPTCARVTLPSLLLWPASSLPAWEAPRPNGASGKCFGCGSFCLCCAACGVKCPRTPASQEGESGCIKVTSSKWHARIVV